MATVEIYTTDYCPWCRRACRLLEDKGVTYVEIDVTDDDRMRAWLLEKTGRRTVPQVFINDEPIGGYDDLAALDRRGELDRLLAAPDAPASADPAPDGAPPEGSSGRDPGPMPGPKPGNGRGNPAS